MKSTEKTTSIVEYLNKIRSEELTVLFGSGISLSPPTNIPTVYRFISDITNELNVKKENKKQVLDRFWNNEIQPRFEILIDEIKKYIDNDLKISRIFSSNDFNINHLFIKSLMDKGATGITTNFDRCIENTYLKNDNLYTISFNGIDLDKGHLHEKYNLIKPHGCIGNGSENLIINISSLAKASSGFINYPNWKKVIKNTLDTKHILVLGYSGSDDFDINPIINESIPKQILWLKHKSNGEIPILIEHKENEPLKNKFRHHNIKIFEGDTNTLSSKINDRNNIKFDFIYNSQEINVVKEYFEIMDFTQIQKKIFKNIIFLHYGLFNQIGKDSIIGESSIIDFQIIKSFYSLNKYWEIIKICDEILKEKKILTAESTFYYSASLSHIGNYAKSKQVYESLINKLDIKTETIILLNTYNKLGAVSYILNHYSDSEMYYSKSIKLNDNSSIQALATSFWGLGDINLYTGNYLTGINYYTKAREVFKNLGLELSLAYMELNIGEGSLLFKKPLSARKGYQNAYERFKELNDRTGQIYGLNGLSKVEIYKDSYKTAMKSNSIAVKLLKKNPKSPPGIFTHLITLIIRINNTASKNEIRNYAIELLDLVIDFEESYAKKLLIKCLTDLKEKNKQSIQISSRIKSFLINWEKN
jgi:hypothetical protein